MIQPGACHLGLVAIILFLGTPSANAGPLYNATALTTQGWIQPTIEGLSNSGQVLLWNQEAAAGAPTYLLYSTQGGGTITPLSYARENVPQPNAYAPQHLGPGGQTVGYIGSQTVLVNGGQVTDIPGWGQAVSANGHVAYETGPLFAPDSFIYSNGTSTNLGTVPGYETTFINGVNDSGQAAASLSHDLTGPPGDYRSQPAFFNGHTLIPLGTFGGTFGMTTGINSQGDVIGYAMNAQGALVGFVSHDGGPLINLGTLPGGSNLLPAGINDSGQIVGRLDGVGAFLYQNGVLTDLSKLLSPSAMNVSLIQAYAINNNGQILAEGVLKDNPLAQPQLFLLTPEGQPVPASPDPLVQAVALAPEPGTLAIFGLMLGGIIARRCRRARVAWSALPLRGARARGAGTPAPSSDPESVRSGGRM